MMRGRMLLVLLIALLSCSVPLKVFALDPTGQSITSDLWIGAVIDTEEKGPVEAVWQKGGEDTTERGDRVIWGHFYASPSDVSWGGSDNPELFVKIWFDVSGRVDVNYFHVSVPDIVVSSDYPYDGVIDEQSTATMNSRYIRQYYEDGQSYSGEQNEDGSSPSGYKQTGSPLGNSVTNNYNIGAIINTEEKGAINGQWHLGGQETTTRGDQVVWGHFYASPSDVSWGSANNPELFVKIWFDASGRVDVNFFHVSVPDIEVYSHYGDISSCDQSGTTITSDRYTRHEYTDPEQGCAVSAAASFSPILLADGAGGYQTLTWQYRINQGNPVSADLEGISLNMSFNDLYMQIDPANMTRTASVNGSLSGDVSGSVSLKVSDTLSSYGETTLVSSEELTLDMTMSAYGESLGILLDSNVDFSNPYEWVLERSDLDQLPVGTTFSPGEGSAYVSGAITISGDYSDYIPFSDSLSGGADTWTITDHVEQMVVSGKTYDNIVVVERKTEQPTLAGGAIEVLPFTITYWVAEGIGMIKGTGQYQVLGESLNIELVSTNLSQ